MHFIEALHRSKYEGIRIVPERYSSDKQNEVQYYYDKNGKFVSQNYSYKPRYAAMNGATHFAEEWCEYTGPYLKFEDTQEKARIEYDSLNEEIGHLYDKFKRLEILRHQLNK